MNAQTTSNAAVYSEKDADGVVTIWLDDPEASANTMNQRYIDAMGDVVDQLEKDIEARAVKGVVVASKKKTFFAGGDLVGIQKIRADQAHEAFDMVEKVKSQLRRLETCGVPVASAINGAALGGGLEITLATHYRVAVDDRSVKLGLPEVTLGLLPGGGGVTRTVRMFGLQSALMDWLLQGQQRDPKRALEKGLIHAVVATKDELLPAARAWVLENADDPEAAKQPWDREKFRLPGGAPSSPKLAAVLPSFPANLRKQLKGADYPAPRAIMSAAVEGAGVDLDTASRIESRYFATLVAGKNSKDMIQAFFFDMQALGAGSLRPKGVERSKAKKVGVLGAGMMGAGIAYACASRGVDVVLKDVSAENAQKGKDYSKKILDNKVSRSQMTQEAADEVLARITPTTDAADLKGCDVIVEAVFEDPELKAKVFAEAEQQVDEKTLLCSNTSTLPITGLAKGVTRPKDFIGLHFFSPVDKMKLVEIIVGEETSDETLARAIDLVQQIGKLPIVVNDSRGFFTSRVFGTYVLEGPAMLEEGIDPMSIDRAGTSAGFPTGPLALLDEVTLSLPRHIAEETKKAAAAEGAEVPEPAGLDVLATMLDEHDRPGRAAGKGFYDYADGKRGKLWPQLRETYTKSDVTTPYSDLQDRYRFAMAIDAARCFEEGVITSTAAANIGSIFGIGFPANTGGVARFIETYEGGMKGFVARANELADAYGERFRPSQWLTERANAGKGLVE
ncbi:3-hydroxyacyl-CoA dehydrogenase [Dermacoccus sp. 147Ba]|uniref:3-hydroxyacyl-CoA dehydrogenase NAD-binding domain-containing protein n=1 Tax=Dermacoccus sp. 147Ba TaxID=2510111 RepID=UPI00101B89F1|nr:3-hydroxyacyl-CoA dehydrogenase NAD-binding domain-containing protein [Dermacoccus sp. 147Ba]RYI24171.1 3-hydroxyacyl-CoA dehydrogenase [Dermacoccus sp. 147Ba]